MKGKNILGWIIKVVKSQFGAVKNDYSWVNQALETSSLSASVKDGLWDVLTALNLKKYAMPEITSAAVKRKSSSI